MSRWSAGTRAWVLAAVGVGFAIVALLVPPRFSRSEIAWSPAGGDGGGAMQLTRSWPERFEAEGRCPTGANRTILDAGGFRLDAVGSAVVVLDRSSVELLRLGDVSSPCRLSFTYDGPSGTVHLDAGAASAETRLKAGKHLDVDRLTAGTDPVIEDVTVLTRPTGATQTLLRVAALLLAGLALVAAFAVTAIGDRATGTDSARRRWFARVDVAIGAGLLVGAFLVPALLDDGWVLERLRWFPVRGVLGSYFDGGDLWLPQGFWNESLLSIPARLGLPFIGLRLLVAVLLLGVWIVLRRWVLDRPDIDPASGQRIVLWPAAAVYLAFALPFLLTMRAEPWVALCAAVAFAALIAFIRRPCSTALTVVLIAAVAAMTAHQSGWILLGPTVVAVGVSISALRSRSLSLDAVARSVVVAAGVGMFLVALPFDISTTRDSISGFGAASGHAGSILSETDRIGFLLTGSAARLFAVMLILPVLAIVLLALARMSRADRLLVGAGLVSLVSLAMTPSKWVWHLGVLAVPAVVLVGVGLRWTTVGDDDRRRNRLPVLAVGLPFIVWLAGMAINRPGGWGGADSATHPWIEFGRTFASSGTVRWWALGMLVAGIVGWRCDRALDTGRTRSAAAAISLVVLLPLLASGWWVLYDTVDSGAWTQARSNVSTLVGRNSCGLLSAVSLVTDVRPLPVAGRGSGAILEVGAFPTFTGLGSGPFGTLEVLGTWRPVTPGGDPNARVGSFSSPRFDVSGQTRIAVWSAGSAETTVVFADASGTESIPIGITAATDSRWALWRLDVPADAVTVSIRVVDGSTAPGGWAAASVPTSFRDVPAREVLSTATSFVGPFARNAYPCARLPDPSSGVWPRVDLFIDDGLSVQYLAYVAPVATFSRTVIGCNGGGNVCVSALGYPMAEIRLSVGG